MTLSDTQLLGRFGLADQPQGTLVVHSPIDGARLARVEQTAPGAMEGVIAGAQAAFDAWRQVPAPRRGELVRLLGEELRAAKDDLGALVTREVGKITSEGLGEVQEMIDICDFAVGLSRQLYGLTIASERPGHTMRETWHPLGPVGIISAFNFPVAVWSWNAALALVCGNPVIWKPSEKSPLTALATQAIFGRALARFGAEPIAHGRRIVAHALRRALVAGIVDQATSIALRRDALAKRKKAGGLTAKDITLAIDRKVGELARQDHRETIGELLARGAA
jgi:aldehyde dehydrogenase (NAD+)